MNLLKLFLVAIFLVFYVPAALASFDTALEALQKKDYTRAQTLFKEAADKNDARAFGALGFMYMQGLGVSHDEKMALDFFKKGASLGDTRAMNSLASAYGRGNSVVTKNLKTAREWAWKSSQANDPQGQFIFFQLANVNELSILDASGKINTNRYFELARRSIEDRTLDQQALTMLSRATERGYSEAVILAAFHLTDRVGETNSERAAHLIRAIQSTPEHQLPSQTLEALKQQGIALSYLKTLGNTYVTPRLYRDTLTTVLQVAFVQAGLKVSECESKNIKVLKIEVIQQMQDKVYLPVDANFLRNSFLIKGSWQEAWTVDLCGRSITVPVTFSADGGGGAHFFTKSIKPKE